MEGRLVQKTFTIDNIDLDCWVIEINHKFWFKARDIAVFLGYKDPDKAVRNNIPTESRKQWDELRPHLGSGAFLPPNWQPHTVMISEGGLYRLICRSTKPEAIRFERWVFDEFLPTIRKTGQYQLEKSFHERLAVKDQQLVTKNQLNNELQEKVLRLCDKVAVMTLKNENKHVFQLYQHQINPNKYIFIRTQSKYLQVALKAVKLEKYEMLLNEVNVPDSMNILNRLRENLKEQNVLFKTLNNKLEVNVDVDVPNMVLDLLEKFQT